MNIKSLQLASRFTLPPNSLGYCGKKTAPAKFIKCALNGKCAGVKGELAKFIVLNPYLETLTAVTGLPKYAYENIEAYWLGNGQLKKAKPEHYKLLLENFSKQGVPNWLISELKQKIPKKFIPNHLFQVLHVGVGRASGSVPLNMESINNCMVRWGKVIKLISGELTVKLNSLIKNGDKYEITKSEETFEFRKDFLPGLKTGDTVAVHWKQAVKILTPEEAKNLNYWTNRILRTVQG